jgi:uncharacterized protein
MNLTSGEEQRVAPPSTMASRRLNPTSLGSPRLAVSLLAFLLGFLLAGVASAFTVPPIEGHVTDLTHVLDEGQRAALNQQMEEVNRGSTVEIAVLVLGSLEGESIDDVGYATARGWKLGNAGKDNGVLLVIATGDRRVRIEVGKGLEGVLTDLQSNDIIRQKIGPELKQGRLYEGIVAGVTSIAAAAAGEYKVTSRPAPQGGSNLSPFAIGIIVVLFLIIFVVRRFFGGGGGYWGGGGYGGGGFGGGGGSSGGDGGGFTGGGGDFGGGGSSDSY